MQQEAIIQRTADYVRDKLEGEGSGHDWWHIYRVWKNSIFIANKEKADLDLYVVQLAALLHDIADFKFHAGDSSVGAKITRDHLTSLVVDKETISHIAEIVENISSKGAGAEKPMRTLEGKVVRDADRLDAIGAIGIARCFAYGGHKGNPIHVPDVKPKFHQTADEYITRKSSQINHFYEKLLLLKDLMLTETGKKLAEE